LSGDEVAVLRVWHDLGSLHPNSGGRLEKRTRVKGADFWAAEHTSWCTSLRDSFGFRHAGIPALRVVALLSNELTDAGTDTDGEADSSQG
jgi:hypothetical protein